MRKIGLCLGVIFCTLCFYGSKVEAKDVPSNSICLKGGEFVPEYKPLARVYDFSDDGVWYGEVDFNWIINPTFEMGMGIGYTSYLIPFELNTRYRLNYTPDQVLVPYVGIGLDFYRFLDQDVIKPKSSQMRKEKENWKQGYHGAVGVQILLDYFSPQQAREMKRKWGVFNTYLNLEAQFSKVDNFGKDELDLGGKTYTFGLLFEF